MAKIRIHCFFCWICLSVLFVPSQVLAVSAKPTPKKEGKITLKTTLVSEYDTNVYNYTRDAIEEYKSYTNPERFNQVKSISDVETSLNLALDFKDILFGHTFIIGIEAEPHFFAQNKIKDFETYRLKLMQYFSRGEYMELRYRKVPRYFVRNLFDRDYDAYRKFTYGEDLVIIGYRRPLMEWLSGRVRYFHFIRDYNGDFKEYDQNSDGVSFTFWQECTRRFKLRHYFEFGKIDAKGELFDTPRTESNTSHNKFKLGFKGTLNLTRRFDVYAEYSFSYQDYTTDNSVSDDPYHAKRNDKLQEIGCGLEYAFNRNTKIFFGYRYGIKDTDTATEDPAEINTSILGHEKSVFSLGLSHEF